MWTCTCGHYHNLHRNDGKGRCTNCTCEAYEEPRDHLKQLIRARSSQGLWKDEDKPQPPQETPSQAFNRRTAEHYMQEMQADIDRAKTGDLELLAQVACRAGIYRTPGEAWTGFQARLISTLEARMRRYALAKDL